MERILLGHGSGGRLMHQLIQEYFAPQLNIRQLSDAAIIEVGSTSRLAFTTDSYVVSPLFFPGGNIGELAVNGTVNDLSVSGACPLFLTAGFIIEEGFPLDDLRTILASMAVAVEKAGVKVVAGDTKVVERGKGDGLFINTCGIGAIPDGVDLGAHRISPGDRVIVSGSVGNHGIAVMAKRNGLSFEPPVLSDTAALNGLVAAMLSLTGDIRMMRDPTRGGVATTLKEIALESGRGIMIREDHLPIPGGVLGACELLGLDPLYVANEGILIAIAAPSVADALVAVMRQEPVGRAAVVIGEVVEDPRRAGVVMLRTAIGGTRVIDMLSGEQLPRIC